MSPNNVGIYIHNISQTSLPKHGLNKDNTEKHVDVSFKKNPMGRQSYPKDYTMMRVKEIILPQGIAHQLTI